MNAASQWKVSYENLDVKSAHRSFFRLFSIVCASSKTQAVELVKRMFSPPIYGNFKVSKIQF
jgi:hypothetical protein